MSEWPIISWIVEMEWYLQILLLICCLALNTYLFVKCRVRGKEFCTDVFFKMLGSNYFCLFIFHRIGIEISRYHQYPDYSMTFWYFVNWVLVMIMFLIFLGAYVTRSNPVVRANRLREIVYPLYCGTLPMLILESFSFDRYAVVRNSEMLDTLFRPFSDIGIGHWSALSIGLIVIGHAISIWALLYLRRSFGIFTEVRNLVRTGPYQYVRHPLYVGENFATVGFCLLFPSWFNIAVTVLFLVSQRLRAHFEEQKFIQAIPEYVSYMGQAGTYLPRLYKKIVR